MDPAKTGFLFLFLFEDRCTNSGWKIVINGNADSWLGCEMTGGEITISSNARDYLGEHICGKIVIDGSVFHKFTSGVNVGGRGILLLIRKRIQDKKVKLGNCDYNH